MKSINQLLADYLESLNRREYFNGAILVSYQDKIIHCKGYGIANHQLNIKNTGETRFRIGSLTKAFIAMAILQLEQSGLIDLKEALDSYIEDMIEGHKITIHHLLSHSSGIQDFASDINYWPARMRLFTTLEDTINEFKNKPLNFDPGTEFRYSNTEYAILAYIIEKISGITYEKYIEDNILKPLGMESTGFDDGRKIIKNLSSGYTIWKEIINPEFVDMTNAKGAYDMYSNVKDLYLWSKALNTEKLVSKNQLGKMFNMYNNVCGYGWFLDKDIINDMQRNKFYHLGDVNGYVNYFCRYIEDDLTIIVLSNFNLTPVEQISKNIATIILGEDIIINQSCSVIRVDNRTLNKYIGSYLIDGKDNKIDIISDQGKVFITIAKRYGVLYMYELLPINIEDSKIEFISKFIEDRVVIEITSKHQFKLTHIDPYGEITHATKLM